MAGNLWLEDGPPNRSAGFRRRRLGIAIAGVTCLFVIAVPVALIVSGGSGQGSAPSRASHRARVGGGPATHQVLSALNATTDSGNFDVSYTFGAQGDDPPTTTTTTSCNSTGSGALPETCSGVGAVHDQPVSGTAVIDVQPFAMMATSEVSGLGKVVLLDDGTDVWEEGGGDYGLSPGSAGSGPGSLLTGFASLVEGTLGPRQGALAMLGLASPTGYLNLDPAETDDADLVGTDTVDGVTVSVYQISMTPSEGGQAPGLTAQEQQATSGALTVLSHQGYTGSTVRVSIDAAGFIRRTQTTDHFTDGTTMTSEAEFSNFGCAGTVVMPGQSGSTSPPAGCTSPDNPTSAVSPTNNPPTAPALATTTSSTSPPRAGAPSTSTPRSSLPSSTTSTSSSTTAPSAPPPPSGAPTTVSSGSGSP